MPDLWGIDVREPDRSLRLGLEERNLYGVSVVNPLNRWDWKSNRISTIVSSFWIIKNLPIGVCLGAYTGSVGRGLSRSVAMTRFGGVPGAALPRSVGKTAVAVPYKLNSNHQLTR